MEDFAIFLQIGRSMFYVLDKQKLILIYSKMFLL